VLIRLRRTCSVECPERKLVDRRGFHRPAGGGCKSNLSGRGMSYESDRARWDDRDVVMSGERSSPDCREDSYKLQLNGACRSYIIDDISGVKLLMGRKSSARRKRHALGSAGQSFLNPMWKALIPQSKSPIALVVEVSQWAFRLTGCMRG